MENEVRRNARKKRKLTLEVDNSRAVN